MSIPPSLFQIIVENPDAQLIKSGYIFKSELSNTRGQWLHSSMQSNSLDSLATQIKRKFGKKPSASSLKRMKKSLVAGEPYVFYRPLTIGGRAYQAKIDITPVHLLK